MRERSLRIVRGACKHGKERYCVRCTNDDPDIPEEILDMWQDQTDRIAGALDEADEVELPGGLIIRRAR